MKKTILLLCTILLTFICHAEVIKTVSCSAGALKTTLTNAGVLQTVSNLTVTGIIDARDLATIKDNLPSIATLDISGASIVAYTGAAGIVWGTSTTYSANEIPQNTFKSDVRIKSITLPNGLISIGAMAFGGSSISGNLNLPNNLTNIGENAFASCFNITGIVFSNALINIGASAFANCTGISELKFPTTLTSIGYNAFNGCNKVTDLNLPTGLTSIGGAAFYACTGISTLSLPSTLTSIGEHAFHGCTGITTLTIPSGITIIELGAFSFCTGLTSVTIPATVSSIVTGAFYNSTFLKTVYCLNAIPPTLGTSCFNVPSSVSDMYVPTDAAVTAYKANADWIAYFPGDIIKKGTPSSTTNLTNSLVKVYPTQSSIIVEGTSAGETVSVYNLVGTKLQTIQSQGERLEFPTNQNGIYLVKTENQTIKVKL